MRERRTTPPPPRGGIRSDELLPLQVLRDRLGVGVKTVAQMRRAGLPIRRCGRQGFVLGSDVLSFFERLPAGQQGEQHDGV